MPVGVEEIAFAVGGEPVAGLLRWPDGEGRAGIVVAGPTTAVKEQAAGAYAAALAERGFVTLAIDHRHFGASGGQPRQYEHPARKVEDLAAAIAWLAGRLGGTVGAVGVCAGAGYMAHAVAASPAGAAFGAVAGYWRDAGAVRESMGDGYAAMLRRGIEAREHWERTGETLTIPAVGRPGEEVAMPLADAFDYYGTSRGAVPGYVNAFAVMSREPMLGFDAMAAAPRIAVPMLLVHGEKALSPAWARKFLAAVPAPTEELWLESRGQTDFYDDAALIAAAADRLAGHFRRHLEPAAAGSTR